MQTQHTGWLRGSQSAPLSGRCLKILYPRAQGRFVNTQPFLPLTPLKGSPYQACALEETLQNNFKRMVRFSHAGWEGEKGKKLPRVTNRLWDSQKLLHGPNSPRQLIPKSDSGRRDPSFLLPLNGWLGRGRKSWTI